MQFLHFLACCRHQLLMSGRALNPLQDRVKCHPLPCTHANKENKEPHSERKIRICVFLQCIIVNWIFWGFGILVWQNKLRTMQEKMLIHWTVSEISHLKLNRNNVQLFCLNRTALRTMASGFSMWTSPNESPQTGACLQHLQGGCAGGGLEKVRVLALCREACPDCCCLAKTAPEKQKTDDGERGEPKGWLVCSFCSVSVFTLEGCR